MSEYQRIFSIVFKEGDTIRIVAMGNDRHELDGNVGKIQSIVGGNLFGTWGTHPIQINRDHFYKVF